MTEAPQKIGPYRIDARLGSGGMAETYLATRRGPGDFEQRVCLKLIRPDLEDDPEFVRQFLAEARIAASLRHASIAQVLDFGQDGDNYYLVFELVEGLDLRALLDGQVEGLRWELVLHLAVEITTALDVAHRAGDGGVVHRDVSPSNVLVSNEGEVKLTDFGIARSPKGPQHTRTGVVKGKVPYMAPEYARTAKFDARVDLFSLGVLLYECLALERPYDGVTDIATLEQSASGRRKGLQQLAPASPEVLINIIERLVEPDPDRRFGSAAELLDALLEIGADTSARRGLAKLVRAQPRTAEQTDPLAHAETVASDASGGTQPMLGNATRTRVADPRPSTPASTTLRVAGPGGGRRRVGWIAATSIGVALLASFALMQGDRSSETPDPQTGTSSPPQARAAIEHKEQTATAQPVDRGQSAQPVATHETAIQETAAQETKRPKATLHVVVIPYGDVQVDGKALGRSPVRVRLSPGEHRIVAETPSGKLRRKVKLSAGQYKKLVLQ